MPLIPHSRPSIGKRTEAAVLRALRSRQVSRGPEAARFETEFTRQFGFKDAAAVASGTAALHLALLSLGVSRKDEVILPTYVCPAVLNAVHYTGARAVLADVEYDDGNLSAASVKSRVTRRTRAIIVPHMFGEPADLFSLLELDIPLIEDCAQSIGALYAGRPAGTLGRVGVFSFYATKMMTTGEGGMVASLDKKIMGRVRELMDYDHRPRYEQRYNYKMDDVRCAMGRAQLGKLETFISHRRALARFYTEEFRALDVVLPVKSILTDPVCYRYVVKVRGGADKVMAAMKAKGINAERPVFRALHQYLGLKGFPVADRLMKESVSLPLYPTLSRKEASAVVRAFIGACKG